MEKKKLNRLESLDVLRGFDLFCLVVLEMVLHPLAHAIDMPWFNSFTWGFSHVEWEGFSTWDLVMPLFLFMAGVSMPFSLSRYKDMPDKMAVYRRILVFRNPAIFRKLLSGAHCHVQCIGNLCTFVCVL